MTYQDYQRLQDYMHKIDVRMFPSFCQSFEPLQEDETVRERIWRERVTIIHVIKKLQKCIDVSIER